MAWARLGKISAVLAAALLLSACGADISGQQERIAVINWEQAVAAHPQYGSLQRGEKLLQDLQEKRKEQEQLAQAQMSSLQKLRSLRQLSQQSYLQAEMNTRLVEQRERENAKLQKLIAAAEAEVEAELAPKRREIEDSYRLRIFNLRAMLGSLKMKPEEKQAAEQQLAQLQHERGSRIMEIESHKQAAVAEKIKPHVQQLQQRLSDFAGQQRENMQRQMSGSEVRDNKLLQDAPQALSNALRIMDREIDKQQEKNDSLRRKITGDLESQVAKLAHQRGYTIVFKKVKASIKADDITEAVAENLKRQ